ncbi:MAG TPA: RNase adapter RapZ [Pyrinomonadaceae bacterium]|nr:RNase adapter RapZ [Pyrinomonadaceae bacterium]
MPRSKKQPIENATLAVITGLSGSGMSSAMNAFEDLGFFCIDNLPVTMISPFVRLMSPNEEGIVPIPKAALVIDIRERHFLADFAKEINKVKKKRLEPTVVFLEASEEVLMRRFSETRRPHPAERGKGLRDAVRQERKAMAAVREKADLIIDTSEHSVHTLRREILRRFGDAGVRPELLVQIMSFGHKYGTPRDVDLQFDVRHLPNPYFVSGLREKTGADRAVVKFLREQAEVSETIDRFSDLLLYLLPQYQSEGKAYLTIAVGCTGGKHRSVMVANELDRIIAKAGFKTSVSHRDMQK